MGDTKSLRWVEVVDDTEHLGRCGRFEPACILPLLHHLAFRLGLLGLPSWDRGVWGVSAALVQVLRVPSQTLPALHAKVLVHLVDAAHKVVLVDVIFQVLFHWSIYKNIFLEYVLFPVLHY